MTLVDLVFRSMRKNIKHYYLYFFALIFGVTLFFIFSTLQFDGAVAEETDLSAKMAAGFKAATILLSAILLVFVTYANDLFLTRRSREIGMYQLVGLSKRAVSRMLIIENFILGAGAFVIGIGAGLLVSRLFLLLLMKLVGYEGTVNLSFSEAAFGQTAILFAVVILVTSARMFIKVRRSKLIDLFNEEKKDEHPRAPKPASSAILGILGVAMIIFGYWFANSEYMLNAFLMLNMLLVLALVIAGTYLVFRVTIGWMLAMIRRKENGHLGLAGALSIAPLMHRMRANAKSLTVITILSAMTLAMAGFAYSLYYSTGQEVRVASPHDFMFEESSGADGPAPEESARVFADSLDKAGISYKEQPLTYIQAVGSFSGKHLPQIIDFEGKTFDVLIFDPRQLKAAGMDYEEPADGVAVLHDSGISWLMTDQAFPFSATVQAGEEKTRLQVKSMGDRQLANGYTRTLTSLVVDGDTYDGLKAAVSEEDLQTVVAFNLEDKKDLAEASRLFEKLSPGNPRLNYYVSYQDALSFSGITIFITGFLGLAFLVSTGSILYFKQMSEAEQEKRSYTTLRQLGFQTSEIMKGIRRKQAFVFGIPLVMGIAHSIFAIKSVSIFFMATDIKIPVAIAMGAYTLIYLVFAVLTVGYYRKTVNDAL
ncbi:ABC transporter permease [Edaphobacillus lindanitolerans]|uniref:Bacitracin transport system permease protein n=1 Tax=Edaphobacillus lindanitolerans TaxID=550447 RepID=A0A1U7PL93_9BACI|nr:ABC transporter permease [Edaphobacillus lindanitolerans]SIT74401.1 bacitracin transport system permease protein [Edaphobacillus lindanitolerans]